jgi:hypothetical protein
MILRMAIRKDLFLFWISTLLRITHHAVLQLRLCSWLCEMPMTNVICKHCFMKKVLSQYLASSFQVLFNLPKHRTFQVKKSRLHHTSATDSLCRFPISTYGAYVKLPHFFISVNFQYFSILKIAYPPLFKRRGYAIFRKFISRRLPCEKMRKIAGIHALRPQTSILILLSKRSAGKVMCPQQCAVTPRGSRPLFY